MTEPVSVTGYAGRELKPAAWTSTDDAILRACAVLGRSATAAGRMIGRSKNACISRAARIGVRFAARPGRCTR